MTNLIKLVCVNRLILFKLFSCALGEAAEYGAAADEDVQNVEFDEPHWNVEDGENPMRGRGETQPAPVAIVAIRCRHAYARVALA